ncbi:MAG: hypothetical protein WCI40_07665 [Verrucomicrobiota bacterium]
MSTVFLPRLLLKKSNDQMVNRSHRIGFGYRSAFRKILARLTEDGLIAANQAGGWDITNLGAILFAKNLDAFKGLSRKAVRVIVYEGRDSPHQFGSSEPQHTHLASGSQGPCTFHVRTPLTATPSSRNSTCGS